MNSLKYIILGASPLTHNIETPVLFPQTLQHASVALCFASYGRPIAAGFCWRREATDSVILPDGQTLFSGSPTAWVCEGSSTSLGIASRGREDAELMEALL